MLNYSFQRSQFELKSLRKFSQKELQKVNLNLNLLKVSHIADIAILDSFYLLQFFSSNKPFVNRYKKSYKQVSLQLMSTVRADSEDYFFKILKLFYFPAIYRRNERFSESQVSLLNFNFTINNVNLLPFLPDIYYKWNIPLNCILSFRSLNKFQLIFYLQLKGYVFKKQ